MSYVIYADVMFFWIFVINVLTYYMACKITNYKIPFAKLIIWCLLVSMLLELTYLNSIWQQNPLYNYLYIFLNILLFIIYVRFVLKLKTISSIIVFLFYSTIGVLALAGGILIFVTHKTSILFILPSITILCLVFLIIHNFCKVINKSKNNIYEILIQTNNHIITTKGYMDTGNTLCDTYSGKYVIIIDYRILRNIIPKKDYSLIESYITTGIFQNISKLSIDSQRIYPLPYKTISDEFAIIPAFLLKGLIFQGKHYENIVAAIGPKLNSKSSNYSVLLNNNL